MVLVSSEIALTKLSADLQIMFSSIVIFLSLLIDGLFVVCRDTSLSTVLSTNSRPAVFLWLEIKCQIWLDRNKTNQAADSVSIHLFLDL